MRLDMKRNARNPVRWGVESSERVSQMDRGSGDTPSPPPPHISTVLEVCDRARVRKLKRTNMAAVKGR